MKEYNLSQLKKDIDNLVEIVYRLNKYMRMEEVVKLISETSPSEEKSGTIQAFIPRENGNVEMTITDKIMTVIKEKHEKGDRAFYYDIFRAFINNRWENMSDENTEETKNAKHRIRGIIASLKQRNKIEGNSKDGFGLVESKS